MRVLIASSGSYGDILPFVAIGQELKRRGHDVLCFASSYFVPMISAAGLEAIGIGPVDAYERVIRHPDAFHPRKGFRLIAETNLEYLPETYHRMEERVLPGETVVVGSTLAFAPRLIRDALGIPSAIVHLAPSVFRSARRPPRFEERRLPTWFPPRVNRVLYWIVDTFVVDPVFCTGLNRFRALLGLKPMKRMFDRWIHEGEVLLGLFPRWFAEPEEDWPEKLTLTGFPLHDGSRGGTLSPRLRAFLDAGDPPVLFTAGTAATSQKSFYRESVEACRRSGLRGLLVTRYPDQLTPSLPEGVQHFQHVAFSLVLPRVAAIVHHGGIGTASQALAAAVPQLVRPLAYDQFDNSLHLQRTGVARELSPKAYRADAVVEKLRELTGSASVRDACVRAKREARRTEWHSGDLRSSPRSARADSRIEVARAQKRMTIPTDAREKLKVPVSKPRKPCSSFLKFR